MIALMDYGMGNLASVAKACRFLGCPVRVTSNPAEAARAQALILPGVGAFGAAMEELKRRRLLGPIRESIESGKPFLGLCLGLQLLLDRSEESPGVRGLGVFPGAVRRLRAGKGLKVPHMGWNEIRTGDSSGKAPNPLLRGIPDGAFVYFVHSFYADPRQRGVVAATTEYGIRFPSVLWDGARVWATQFHPEKSQRWGLMMLKNFLSMETCCHADRSCN